MEEGAETEMTPGSEENPKADEESEENENEEDKKEGEQE
jgi:hypothetical protein